MQKVLLFIFSSIAVSFAIGQDIDQEKMNRDIEVAENILSSLIHKADGPRYLQGFRNEQIEGSYIKDYGVILSVKKSGFGYSYSYAPEVAKVISRVREKAEPVPGADDSLVEINESDETNKSVSEQFIEGAKSFLVDYGTLIRQLDDDDHIMVKLEPNRSSMFFLTAEEFTVYSDNQSSVKSRNKQKITAEISVRDVKAINAGSLSREKGLEKVKITESSVDDETYADLELLSTMFQRLYQRDLADTYYSASGISYEKLSNLGAIFRMKVYSSTEVSDEFFMPTIEFKAKNIEERNKKVMELLPAFEKGFRENLVNYGRTVKSLQPDETLLFEVEMTQCNGCNGFPTTIKFSVKKSVLDRFNKGSLSLQEAAEMVEVEKKI